MQLAKGEFGGRVGIWRLIRALFDFRSRAIKATIFTPGRIRELYADALRAPLRMPAATRSPTHMWEHHVPRDMQLELDHLRKTGDALSSITGRHGRWACTRLARSLAVVAARGRLRLHITHECADHLPYYLRDADGRQRDAQSAVSLRHRRCDVLQVSALAPDRATRRSGSPTPIGCSICGGRHSCNNTHAGGYLNVCLHPFVSGRAQRIRRCWTFV